VAPSLLYTLEFEAQPPWRSTFLDQPHFDGSPLPPFYAGMSPEEMLTNTPAVTNAVTLPALSNATTLDNSPELRRHPILDNFVASMGNDPVALANYVINSIGLTDPMSYNDDGDVSEQCIDPPGVRRSALGSFLEKQGSPIEECALLVYLLRQAGVPAVYEFAPHNGLQMLDARLSQMLKCQIHGSYNEAGAGYTTNTMIPVNYPWVAAYIGTNWVHIFPWLKDYKITEGFDLYDFMPSNYPNAYAWVQDYVYGNSNLMSLSVSGNDTPSVIFPAYLRQTLLQNHPGVSVDDIGVQILQRQHYYSRWQDFPTPTALTNLSFAVESLTSSGITNVDPLMTNIFDTMSVEVFSVHNPTNSVQTGEMRLCDLHDREFYISQTATNTNSIQLNLVLMPYRTNITTQAAFSNDPNLLAKEVLSMTLGQYDEPLTVRFRCRRNRVIPATYAIDPTKPFLGYSGIDEMNVERPLRLGDQAAICMTYGQVTSDMINVQAVSMWQMENAVHADPSSTNSVSPDVYEGETMCLAGMSYYQKVGRFDKVNQRLHKVNTLSLWAVGLSKISAARNSSDGLAAGIDPVLPNVDMFFYEMATIGNQSVQLDSGQTQETSEQNYNLIAIANASAEEHHTINSYYQQTNAVSTVRLLQIAQNSGMGIVPLNVYDYAAKGQTVYQGTALQDWDASIWSSVTTAFQSSYDGSYVTAYLTPGPMTNSSYKGMAALILGWSEWQALITPSSMNGAFGSYFQPDTISAFNTPSFSLVNADEPTISLAPPVTGATLAQNSVPDFTTSTYFNLLQSGTYVIDPTQLAWSTTTATLDSLPISDSINPNYANTFSFSQQNGGVGAPNNAGSGMFDKVLDPVHSITGEFLVDETDLQLPGPLPLSLRRNYSSQNLADNQFGPGWKLSIMPYLTVALGGTNIFAADMDGSVLAYVQTNLSTNVYVPSLAANPQLNNETTAGVGGLANRLRDRLVQTVSGSTTNYILYGADGSTRTFQTMTFASATLTNTRPYLLNWTDSRGNYYTFTYGTDSSENSFGQVTRIQSSNGNFLGLYYDIYGHITQAYCGDGRRLEYEYDEYNDLVTVTLPDATTRSYVYEHAIQAVTNGSAYYSTHLIIEEDKPDGRVLRNAYDSQRRVTNQCSTAGVDLMPVRTATFVYSNDFVLTNAWTNTVTGYTLILDGYNNTNRFDYSTSLITKITDPLGQSIQQTWYPDNTTSPGYPRSLSQMVDKRGMTNQFQYDCNGNVTNTITFGDITGDGITTQTTTNTAIYNTNSLPTQMTDAAGNGTQIIYDPVFTFLPQQTIRYAGTIPICTNYSFYSNATNMVTNGNVTQTNIAFGLTTRQIRAFSSPDAATNDTAYNGNGFINELIRYSGSADPNVSITFYYNERGQMVNQIDALGAVTFFDYDAMNRPIEQDYFDESGNILSWSLIYYTDNGEISWIDGPRYNPEDYIFYDYDGDGRRTSEIHWLSEAKPDGTGVEARSGYSLYAQSFYQYDLLGNMTLAVDPRGAMTTNIYDPLCRLVQTTHLDTNGVTVLSADAFSYEPGGKVQSHTNAVGGVTTTFYNITGKVERRNNPDGSTNGWRYYLDGRLKRQIQSNGAYWQTIYDDIDLITTRVFYSADDTPLATNSTQLDRRGNVIQRIDEANNVFTTTFDGLDRVKVVSGPSIVTVGSTPGASPDSPITYVTNLMRQVTTNYYDAAGRSLTNVNALGDTTVTKKDAMGRTISTHVFSMTGSLVREKYFDYSPDHNSITITDGSGTNAISQTTWTDTEGHAVLSVAYPSPNILDYTLNSYDLAGNLAHSERDNSSFGIISTLSKADLTYDGLNRLNQKTDRDNAITTYAYDALNDLTNRTIPGGLQWQAAYNNAGQLLQEQNVGAGSSTRTTTYSYFAIGNPFAGLLLTKTDGRDVTCTYGYDNWLHITTNVYTGSLPEQNLTTILQYEPRGFVTNYSEHFATSNTGPVTSVQRQYDPYGQLVAESVNGGLFTYSSTQNWDATGRRTKLGIGSGSYGFAWRADGSLISAADVTGIGNYSYDTAGLLISRTVGARSTGITSRDGEGRPNVIVTTLQGDNLLTESMSWSPDGLLATHILNRSDFTDFRSYSYADLSRRLIQEQLNLSATDSYTNMLGYDNGVPAGPGVLTSAGQGCTLWSGVPDSYSRINTATNNSISYAAYGHVNGRSALSLWLDNHPISVTSVGTNTMQWRSMMELSGGAHQLRIAAAHPSGQFTAWATNSFTNGIPYQTSSDIFDNAGNISQRVWCNANGTTNHIQTLAWDARGRLHFVTERDSSNSGYDWTATYDALSRRLSTTSVLVTNGVVLYSLPISINSYFDPQVEFLELGVTYGTNAEWKLYGPDLNGKYGGLNGTGGFDGVSRGTSGFSPVISDFRGNVLGVIANGVVLWNPARPTGFGAVPGYRPLALESGVSVAAASAWRGHWPDITGYYQIGTRTYDPISGQWHGFDPVWNGRDPNAYTFCGGDPINIFDADGRFGKGFYDSAANAVTGTAGLARNIVGSGCYGVTSYFNTDFANQKFGAEWQGLQNTVSGFHYLADQVEQENYSTVGELLTGGRNQTGYYRAGYAVGSIALILAGGEISELGDSSEIASTAGTVGDTLDVPALANGTLTSSSKNAIVAAQELSDATAADTGAETFYRTMSQTHYDQLLNTGRLPATSETFISPSLGYASQYDGVTVQFGMKAGTTDSLLGMGVRNSGLSGGVYDSLPLVQKGWGSSSAFFKIEGDVVNVGLGKGAALDTFNNNILNFKLIGK